LARDDRDQQPIGLQRFKLSVILNSRKVQAVHFGILEQQGFMRRPEHWVPEPTEAPVPRMLRNSATHGEGAIRHPAANQRQEHHRRELKSNRLSHYSSVRRLHLHPLHCFPRECGYSNGCCQAVQSKTTMDRYDRTQTAWLPGPRRL